MRTALRTLLSLSVLLPVLSYAGTPGELLPGQSLREATLHSLTGKDKHLSDYRGKPLIINVWASWCGPCRTEMSSLNRLAQRYSKQFTVIGISTDDDALAAKQFIKRAKLTFENFIDSNVLLENMLGADTIPLTILVDAQGHVLEKARGAYAWDSAETVDAIGQVFHLKLQR